MQNFVYNLFVQGYLEWNIYKAVGKLKISDVRVRLVQKEDSKLKAVASMTIEDCFVVHDIKVIEGQEGYFIAMPSRKASDGEYKDIVHPINTETRQQIINLILEAFNTEKEKEAQ